MAHKYLAEQEKQVSKHLRRNTLIASICAVAGFGLLIPAFSVAGSRFDQQEFCFLPKNLSNPEQHDFCTGAKVRRGVAWRVALEIAESQEFRSKVTLLDYLPAQNPHAGFYGLAASGFFFAAFAVFKCGTSKLEDTLDVFVWNKKSVVLERALQASQHIDIEQLKKQQEGEFIKDILNREHGDALYSLMNEGERELAAKQHHKAIQLDDAQFNLQLAAIKAQSAELNEKEVKHQKEIEKLNKSGKTDKKSSALTPNEAAKAELSEKLKDHEGGWLWTLANGKTPLIIYGKQGAYKSYTAASMALIKMLFQDAKIVSIADFDAEKNLKEAWKELIPYEPEVFGAEDNEEEYAEAIEKFFQRCKSRNQQSSPVISIWDELTVLGKKLPDLAPSFMPMVISKPRKTNENPILLTHSITQDGLGGVEKLSEAIKEGTIRLKLKADGLQQPLFKGEISGWVDSDGSEINDSPISLPDWLRPEKIAAMLEGKNA